MKKIVAFGASSSKKSINKQFASYAASLISDADSIIIDLNDFEKFLKKSDIIITNRYSHKLNKVSNKVYTRDIYGEN